MNFAHGYSFGTGLGAGFWVLIILIGIGVWALVALGIVSLVRTSRTRPAAAVPVRYPMTPAEAILTERFARGEIGEEEFRSRMNTLRGGPTPPPPPPASPPPPPSPES